MSRISLVMCVLTMPSIVSAQSLDSIQNAQALGTVLASEEICGLRYDQDAISRWIDGNTDPSDMSFSSNLNMMTEGSAFMFEGMSESSKTAHCRSIERTSRHFGFIE